MADITKKVNRGIPTNERTQVFNQTDAGTGDVLLVKDSLGKPASRVTIEAVAAMTIKVNVYHTIYPKRDIAKGNDTNPWAPGFPNIAAGVQYKDETVGTHVLDVGDTLVFADDIPVRDIEIVAASGDFVITVA